MEDRITNAEGTDNSQHIVNAVLPAVLWRDERHSHFWIEDEELYESYNTIRGLRYRWRLTVNGLPDTDKVPDDMLLYIQAEFL